MNDLERNGIIFPTVTINTKFLNCLQPEWLKYVTQAHLAKRLTEDSYDDLFDYLYQYEKLMNASRAKKIENAHDPLALVAQTGSSSRTPSPYYVTHPSSVVDYDDDYQRDALQNNFDDQLTSAMMLLARVITQRFSNPINNRLCTPSNTRNQVIVQENSVNIQRKTFGNSGRNARQSYVQDEIIEGNNVQSDCGNIQRTLRTMSLGSCKCSMLQLQMEELKELSANICLMAILQPVNINSDERPSNASTFLSENPKLYNASSFSDTKVHVKIRDTEDIRDDATKSQMKMENKFKDPIVIEKKQNVRIIDYNKLNALYEDFVPQKELSAEQKYFSSTFICLENPSNASLSNPPSKTKPLMPSSKEIRLTKFCQQEVKPILHGLQLHYEIFQKQFSKDIKEMKDVFESTERDLCATWKLNKLLNDQLLEVKLKHEIECCVLMNHECSKDYVKDEIEKIQKDSIEIQEHMNGNLSRLNNFVEQFMSTVCFRNNHFAAITGYGNYVQGNITICHVYYVEGLGYNLFSVGQFCDGDRKVAFRSNTCYMRNLEGDDLLTGAHVSNLYTISISDMAASLPVCLISKANLTKSWLWHRRLSHLNFGTINDLTKHNLVDGLPKFKNSKDHLCSACERGKSKKSSHPPKLVSTTHSKLELLHVDLYGPMRVATINEKKYILVIVESMQTLSNEDLDNLFGPMYEEYFKKRPSKVSINFATQKVYNNKDSPSTSLIIVEEQEAPPIVTSFDEQSFAISRFEADELNQEDLTEFDGNTLLTPYDVPNFNEAHQICMNSTKFNPQHIFGQKHILWNNQPNGFVDQDFPNQVYRLKKVMYGLKQAPRAWYGKLSLFLTEHHFTKGIVDLTLFMRRHGGDILLVQVYVDDKIFGSINPYFSKRFANLMKNNFEMLLMGELKFFLGLQVHQSSRGIFISQSQYTIELLKKHGIDDCVSMSTPMAKENLDADLQGTPTDQMTYRRMIGGLMYLISSRIEINFATFVCARYQARPTVKHLKEVKKIFRYIRQSYNMGLWYLKDSRFELIAYSDADHTGCKEDCKSTSGGLQFLGEKLVSCSSKKQDYTAMSTAEAKYVSLSTCCAQVIWMRTQLLDYGYKYNKIPRYCDSKSAIAISCNPVQHSRTKHIDIRYHFIKEHVEKGTVELYFVRTEYQLAFTKALPNECFEYLIYRIVPWIYLGQFWHTLEEDGNKYRLKFMLKKKELTLTFDDFRRIFQLPQATDNNHARFVPALKFLEMAPFFINDLGFTLELRTPSNFKTNGIIQPWQTLCKMFARCLTTRVTGHDQPPLQIMHMLYCFVNNLHSQAEMAKMIAEAIQQDRKNLRLEITSQINNDITNYITSQVDSSSRNYMTGHILHVHPTQAVAPVSAQEQQYQLYLTMRDNPQLQQDDLPIWLALEDQDDLHDDAHPEGENDAKRLKTSEHGTYVCVESSSGQVRESELGPSSSGIEKYKLFFIVFDPMYGIIYKNNKKEKRVMRHQKIHKFCDATLKRVLEGLKSYNNDVKHGYVNLSHIKEDVETLQLFEEEIKERLKYCEQIRRWEIKEQSTYLHGRQIIDGPLMVNEIINWVSRRRSKMMIFKSKWVKGYLNSSYTSVLVNESPTQEFKVGKGVRQGDLFSHFLFLIMAEALSVAIEEAIEGGVARNEVDSMASTPKCTSGSLPLDYLGLPVGATMSISCHWSFIIEKEKEKYQYMYWFGTESDGILNDATSLVTEEEVVSSSVVDETGTTTAGNTPGKSSYANVTGKPSGTKVNFRTLFTPRGNGIDVVFPSCSSYARSMIELRVDVELKDNIMVENNVELGTSGGTSNLASQEANSSGSLFWNMDASRPSTTPIIKKIDKIEKLIIDGKVTLVDDEGKHLEKVVSSGDYDTEDEVASVDNEMASFLAKKDSYGIQSLL
uniref:Retrovirus-related Pol polyprotein from transposon TNT 1-94 n=1 Tax=Tanacetum cinerariifolium TaxID=118510 RepID=A0A6L2MSS2_TANCI|nr:retrovirus-related Pol polyprotein from transposon TNT 1-94 [Tanacetum cinerariifolium]